MNNSTSNAQVGLGYSNKVNSNLSNADNSQSYSIGQGRGEKKIETTTYISTSNQALIGREIESESASNDLAVALIDKNIDSIKSGDSSDQDLMIHFEDNEGIVGDGQLFAMQANYIFLEIQYLIKFIKKYIDADFEFNLIGNWTFRLLLKKQGELHAFIMTQSSQIALMHQQLMHHSFGLQLINQVEENMEEFGGKDVARNMVFIFCVHREIFIKYYEFNEERNKVLNLNLNKSGKDTIVSGFGLLVKNAIRDLRGLVSNKYYTLLRPMLSFSSSIYDKAKILLQHFGNPKSKVDSLSSEEIFQHLNAGPCFAVISNTGCYLSKLQILIDLLTDLNECPKTLDNLKLLLAKCEDCFNYYEEDLSDHHEWLRMTNCSNSSYFQDYKDVKLYLKGLVDQLTKLKVEASWATPISNGANKKKKQQPGGKKKQVNSQLKKQQTTVNQAQKKQAEIQIITIGTPIEAVQINTTSSESLQIGQKEIVSNINNTSIKSEEDGLEDIVREANELFEALRQLIEKDRKVKLELKELKAAQKKRIEEDEDKIIIIEKKPEILKLSTGHQLTLDAIFSEEDCHLKLSGSEIENLINALGGKAKPGSKKKINIFWGNSTKKAGSYEVTHGGDCDGCLTRNYVERVKGAILVGVQMGFIAKETISFPV